MAEDLSWLPDFWFGQLDVEIGGKKSGLERGGRCYVCSLKQEEAGGQQCGVEQRVLCAGRPGLGVSCVHVESRVVDKLILGDLAGQLNYNVNSLLSSRHCLLALYTRQCLVLKISGQCYHPNFQMGIATQRS